MTPTVTASHWGTTPRRSIEAECARRGERAVVAGCVNLLAGRVDDAELLRALGGPAATTVLHGQAEGVEGYWPRVWGARGLLCAWGDAAGTAVIRATADDAWRVREMVAKVVAKRRLGRAVPAMAALCDDPVPRVRRAAERALQMLVAPGARDGVGGRAGRQGGTAGRDGRAGRQGGTAGRRTADEYALPIDVESLYRRHVTEVDRQVLLAVTDRYHFPPRGRWFPA